MRMPPAATPAPHPRRRGDLAATVYAASIVPSGTGWKAPIPSVRCAMPSGTARKTRMQTSIVTTQPSTSTGRSVRRDSTAVESRTSTTSAGPGMVGLPVRTIAVVSMAASAATVTHQVTAVGRLRRTGSPG